MILEPSIAMLSKNVLYSLQTSRLHVKLVQETETETQEEAQSDRPDGAARISAGVAGATILLACFIAEHNLSFLTADYLVDLMKIMFSDSAIAQGLNMKRTRCTEVTKILGRVATEDLIAQFKANKLPVIVEESTDTGTGKCSAVIVRFIDAV